MHVHAPLVIGGLSGVAAVAPNDVRAVGGDKVVHYDGTTWRVVVSAQSSSPHGLVLQGIAMVSADEGWAAADGGLLPLRDGTWTAVMN